MICSVLLRMFATGAPFPGGYFQISRSGGGGLGPHIKFGGKIWGKVRPSSPIKRENLGSSPSSPIKRENLGSSVTTRRRSWGKVPSLGSYLKFRGQNLGYLSLLFLEAKFGAPTRILEANFGAKPPRPPNMEVPPWGAIMACQVKFGAKILPAYSPLDIKVKQQLQSGENANSYVTE